MYTSGTTGTPKGVELLHGPYRPQPGPPPDEQARARQELLEAAERYGSLSPQARAAAEKVKRLSG